MNPKEIVSEAYERAVIAILKAAPGMKPEQASEIVNSVTELMFATISAHLAVEEEDGHEQRAH